MITALLERTEVTDVTRRELLIGGVSLAALLAGCGSGQTASPPAPAGGFPIEVDHALGTITIRQRPERVVALNDRDADTMLALGLTPVGIHTRYGFERGVGPWAEEALGDATPMVWTGEEFNYEGIAAAKPDLIVHATSGGERDIYDRLSRIAPMVALPKGAVPYGATTEESTLLIAEALGARTDGDRVVAELDAFLAQQAVAYPSFAVRTVNYLDIYPGGILSYSRDFVINRTLYAVGFDPIERSAFAPGEESVEVSAERLADYDADVLIVYPFERTEQQLREAIPTFASLDAVRGGRLFLLEDFALSNSSVLSIPYALNALLPKIDGALRSGG